MSDKHLYEDLTTDEKKVLLNSSQFFNEVERMCNHGVHCSVGTMIERLQESGQFESELEELRPAPDYEAACDENHVEVVDGVNDIFYFRWDDLASIDIDGSEEPSMIDWNSFAAANGIDLSLFAWDSLSDEPVLKSVAVNPSFDGELAEGGVFEAFASSMLADGKEAVGMLASAASQLGLNELSDKLSKQSPKDMKTLLFPHINKNFVSSQSNDDLDQAYVNACSEFNLEPEYNEILEYWSVSPDFARRLRETGHVVAEIFDLEVWGRTTSGQSMALDYSIQQMALSQWGYGIDEVIREVLPEAAARIEAQRKAERGAAPAAPTLG